MALALAVGWAVFLKLAGPARYMLAPWDEGYVENGWPRGAFVFVHAATIFLGAGFLFGATWVLVLRWGEGREWVASLVVVAVSGALVWGSLAHLARAQHAYDDQVLTRWAIEEGRAGVEIGGAGEWALVTTGGRLTFGAVGESGRVVGDLCEGSVEPCRRIDLGFRLAEGEKRPVQVLLGVAPEASLWYRRGGEFAFLLGEAEEAGRKGSPASRVRLDPRWRPEDRRWETVDLEMEAGRRYVLLVSAPPGAPLAAVAFHPGE